MIINFAVDPAVIKAASTSAVAYQILFNFWIFHRIGVLYDLVGADGSAFDQAIAAVPNQDARKDWAEAQGKGTSEGLLRPIRASGLCVTEYTADIVAKLAPHIDLMIVNSGEEHRYGGQVIQSNSISTTIQFSGDASNQLELVAIGSFPLSNAVQSVLKLRGEGNIPQGFPVHDIWKQRFRNLFNVSKEVHIVDRYALSRIGYGLGRWIEMAKIYTPKTLKEKRIHIYTELQMEGHSGVGPAVMEASERVRNWLSSHLARPHPFGEIVLHFVPGSVFSRDYKDRYIRFGKVGAIGGGHGVAIFEGRNYKTDGYKGVSWNADVITCRQLESTLTNRAVPSSPTIV